MFPYKDDNPTVRTPVATFALIAINVLVWVLLQGLGTEPQLSQSVCQFGLVPGEVLGRLPPGTPVPGGIDGCVTGAGHSWLTVLSSMFMHGGWLHLIGNMWFLWVFGNNIEDSMGRVRFVVFYLTTGLVAAAAQALMNPSSAIPMVGASGAISGVMGAYVVLYPFARVYVLVPLGFFITTLALPAWTMIGYWALIQFVSGVVSIGAEASGGVAFWAHVGGLVAGIVSIMLFARRDYVEEHRAQTWTPSRYGWR